MKGYNHALDNLLEVFPYAEQLREINYLISLPGADFERHFEKFEWLSPFQAFSPFPLFSSASTVLLSEKPLVQCGLGTDINHSQPILVLLELPNKNLN